ncbi:MAG: hypothetical protein CL811_12835 [Colwelliaceae bacterium]|nr:hypothetical protein [Colwelliaceae bacterium]|tara:strand:- start:106 stop:360 length:255 start_codon:yes stop_codon:yes gene_type:complete
MEPITVKFEDSFLKDIEMVMKKHRFATKAEFIRQAIREKMNDLEKQESLERLRKMYGASHKKTTDKDLKKIRKEVFDELEKDIK